MIDLISFLKTINVNNLTASCVIEIKSFHQNVSKHQILVTWIFNHSNSPSVHHTTGTESHNLAEPTRSSPQQPPPSSPPPPPSSPPPSSPLWSLQPSPRWPSQRHRQR